MNDSVEKCMNPWLRKGLKCHNTDIVVSLIYKDMLRSICSRCWRKIANSKREW